MYWYAVVKLFVFPISTHKPHRTSWHAGNYCSTFKKSLPYAGDQCPICLEKDSKSRHPQEATFVQLLKSLQLSWMGYPDVTNLCFHSFTAIHAVITPLFCGT